MKTFETMLKTTAIHSDDEAKRYLLSKVWDETKPKLAIIMLVPSTASTVALDSTTQLVLNNANRLGYGKVDILNLFATLNDYSLSEENEDDADNLNVIVASAKEADTLVYAAGVGKAKNELFIKRQMQVLLALKPFESKLNCIGNDSGSVKLRHPLSPAVRSWTLYPLHIGEIIPEDMPEPVKDKKAKAAKRNA